MTDDTNKITEAELEQSALASRRRAEQSAALWELSPEQRAAAMWRSDLTLFQLVEWSSLRPYEVPRIATDLTASGEPGEFAWIVMSTPEWADAGEDLA